MLSGVRACVWSKAIPAVDESGIRVKQIAMLQNALVTVAGSSERDKSIKYATLEGWGETR
jgi:hypothetical protein